MCEYTQHFKFPATGIIFFWGLVVWGYRISRHSQHDDGRVDNLTHLSSLPTGIYLFSFLEAVSNPGLLDLSDSTKKSSVKGYKSRDYSTSSAVPQLLSHPRVVSIQNVHTKFTFAISSCIKFFVSANFNFGIEIRHLNSSKNKDF
jgi:hypothetical protein